MRRLLFALLLIAGLTPKLAFGLAVEGVSDSVSTVAPADDFGFANVGRVFDKTDVVFATGIYLGSGWMLSAYHVVRLKDSLTAYDFGDVYLDKRYTVDPASAVRLKNQSGQFVGMNADLVLFHLNETPNLPSVKISASASVAGTSVILAGNGLGGTLAKTRYTVNSSVSPPVWTETTSDTFNKSGVKYTDQKVRWGSNDRAVSDPIEDQFGSENAFQTLFSSGVPGDAQATPGDSGGGVFVKRGAQWELYGLILEATAYAGQPSNTAIYGNATFAAQLSDYQAQITSVVPEAGTGGLIATGGLAMGFYRRRRC